MREFLFILLLCFGFLFLRAQNAMPLNTPYYWLKEARKKAASKDTAGTFLFVENAVRAGLFDPQAITDNRTINEILSVQQKEQVAGEIHTNRKGIENPSSIKLVTEDINRFWKLYPHINDSSAGEVFLDDYIMKGSTGLRTFYQIRMNSSLSKFVQKIRAIKSYYSSIKVVWTARVSASEVMEGGRGILFLFTAASK